MEILIIEFIKTEFFAIIFVLTLSFIIRMSTKSTIFVWFIKFPGMILHELAHLSLGILTFAHPSNITLFPKRQNDGTIVLGSVSFLKINNFNAFLISMAPLLLMILAYFLFKEEKILNYIYEQFNIEQYWIKRLLKLYLLTILLSSSIPSSMDFKVMFSKYIGSILWIVLIVFLIYFFKVMC